MSRLPAILLIFAAAHAGAQSMKPGQWELNSKMKSANVEVDQAMTAALQQLNNLPPAQRQQMEQMMAQNGATMPRLAGDGGVVMSACITPEMAARHELPTGQQGQCSSHTQQVSGGLNVSFSCTNPPSSGQGQVRFRGDTGFTMNMNVTTSARGTPEQMTVETSGHWLGPNCAPGQR
jgi:hypothetical protein